MLTKLAVGLLINFIDECVLYRAPALTLVPIYRVRGRTNQVTLAHVQGEVLFYVQFGPPWLVGFPLAYVAPALLHCGLYVLQHSFSQPPFLASGGGRLIVGLSGFYLHLVDPSGRWSPYSRNGGCCVAYNK